MGEFQDAIRKAIGSGVPCYTPCSGIELLQLINHNDVVKKNFFSREHVIRNFGNNAETLITNVNKEGQEKLEKLVREAGVIKIKPRDVEWLASWTVDGELSIPLDDLAKIGLKAKKESKWKLSFKDSEVKKKSVNVGSLNDFLVNHVVDWDAKFKGKVATITSLYVVTGALKFTSEGEFETNDRVHVSTPANVLVELKAGWKYTVTESGTVELSKSSPDEWIIAIEYIEISPGKDGKVTPGQLVTAKKAQQPNLDELK